jgi:Transposase IS4
MSSSRPSRVRAAPARLQEEQEEEAELAATLAQLRAPRAAAAAAASSEDESSGAESGPEEGEECKESDRRRPHLPWSTEHAAVRQQPFTPPHRRHSPPHHCSSALDFFHLFFPIEYLDFIAEQTNAYARLKQHVEEEDERMEGDAEERKERPAEEWSDTSREEVQALLGCLVYMGIVSMNDTRDYWEAVTQQSFVTQRFPRHRFLALLSSLRFSDEASAEAAAADPLHKLRQLLDTLAARAQQYFYPGKHLTVDEAMVAFKGRSSMRQHIAKKKSPTGFKVWTLVDSATNYVYSFDVFAGRKEGRREEGLTAQIVLKLCSPLDSFCWHLVVMDSYFSSVALFRQLLARGFYALGTARHSRRDFPKELLDEVKQCGRGEWAWRQAGEMAAVSWMDKKPVNLLSTGVDPTLREIITRRSGREEKEVSCPAVLPLYTQHMRGVDVLAQRLSYSKLGRRSKKWFYSLSWFLFDIGIHNAFILYQAKHNKQHYREKDFRKQLMELLVGDFTARKAMGRPVPKLKRPQDRLHRLVHSERHGDCKQCRRKLRSGQHGRQSHYRCEDCQVFLCVPDCYNKHIQALAAESAEAVDE